MPKPQQQFLVVPRIPLLDILPPEVRKMLAGKPVGSERMGGVIRLPQAVLRRIRTPEKILVSEWAAKFRVVTDGAHEGKWRHSHAPPTVKIMDTFGLSWVREIWFCGVEQSGKTNTMLNCMAWAIDCDPGNIFYLMPTEDTAAKITGGKIKPMLERCKRLRKLLSKKQDDTTLARIKLLHGVTIFPAHANSASSMASWAAKHCFGDEVDKYPELVGQEADPITLIEKRNRNYRGRYKRFFASTPAGKFIVKGLKSCQQIWEYRLRCPECNELVRPEGEHLDLDENSTVEQVHEQGCLLACPNCGTLWDDLKRTMAIKLGAWVAIKGGDLARPETVGFHHRAWDCLDIPIKEIAVAWIKGKKGSIAKKIAWANGYEAMDYRQVQVDRDEDFILRLKDESLPRKAVPSNTSCLLLLVDTQKYGFRYQVWACGWGEDMTISVIDRGMVHGFGNLVDLAGKDWKDADGNAHRVAAAWIDSGGGTDPYHPKHSRTREVYLFCKKNPVFSPIKGRRTQTLPWNITRLEYLPSQSGKKVPIPGGLNLYTLNVTLYKNDLATTLAAEPGDPGGFRLHAEIGKDYAAQMCAEYQDDRGFWICPDGKDNHDWDISVYGMAAIDIMGIRDWKPEPEEPEARIEQPAPRRRRW